MFRLAAMVLACSALAGAAHGQDIAGYPSRPVRIIVDVAPGGGVDTATRLVAAKLEQHFGRAVYRAAEGGTGVGHHSPHNVRRMGPVFAAENAENDQVRSPDCAALHAGYGAVPTKTSVPPPDRS